MYQVFRHDFGAVPSTSKPDDSLAIVSILVKFHYDSKEFDRVVKVSKLRND